MKIRLLDPQGKLLTGKVVRTTRSQIHIRTQDGRLTACRFLNGEPSGRDGFYRIHPEDLGAAQSVESVPVPRRDRADSQKTAGTPSHWRV